MSTGKKVGIFLAVALLVGGAYFFKLWPFGNGGMRKAIEINN